MTDIKFVQGSATSQAAAESMEGVASSMQERVRLFIAEAGEHGATDDEIEAALGLRHQTASARRRELVLKEIIKDSGRVRKTRSNRKATVWVSA